MQLINIGFGNMVVAGGSVIVSPDSAPIKRLVRRPGQRRVVTPPRAAHPGGDPHGQRSCDPLGHSAGDRFRARVQPPGMPGCGRKGGLTLTPCIQRKGMLIIISGPSGTGKGTLVKKLMDSDPSISFSCSVTTRPPREGELEGVHYHFISQVEYDRLLAQDAFWSMPRCTGTGTEPFARR